MKKLISILLVVTMLFLSTVIVLAGKDDMTSKFYLSDIGYPAEVTKYVNGDNYKSVNGGPVVYGEGHTDKYNTSGGLLTYGYYQSPVVLTNDVFSQAVPYMCYGVENSTTYSNNNNQIRFVLDSPAEIKENDGIYISFYYRAADSFYGVGGKASTPYTGVQSQMVLYALDNANQNVQVISDTQASGVLNSSKVTIVPDNTWHRLDMTIMMDSANYAKLSDKTKFNMAINLNQIFDASYIEFAGFRMGVLRPEEAITYNQMLTEVSWHLQKKVPSAITVNGTALDLASGATEFTVPGKMDEEPVVAVSSDDGVQYEVEKLAYNRYKLTTYAGGYDVVKTLEENVMFRERYNNGAFSGNNNYPKYLNSALVGETYYINIDIEDNFTMYPLSTDWDAVAHGCDNSLRNVWAEYTSYARSPETWADDTTFKSGYTMKLLKPDDGSKPTQTFNTMQAKFDLGDDTIETGDIVYFHFYIKSDTSNVRFTPTLLGKDAKNSTPATDDTAAVNVNVKTSCLAYGPTKIINGTYFKNSSTNYPLVKTDTWLKFTCWYRVTEDCRIEDTVSLPIYFNWFTSADYAPANIKMADFSCGVLRNFTPVTTEQYLNDQVNTALTAALTEAINVYDFKVDGKSFETEGETTVVSEASVPAPEIGMTAYHGALPVNITREPAGNSLPAEYTVKVYSPAYDKSLAETATLNDAYGFYNRPVTANDDGTYTRENKDITNIKNSSQVKTYSLMVSKAEDYSDYVFEIDGKRVTDFTNLKGSNATFGARFDKFDTTGYKMILAAYDADKKLVSVNPVSYTYSDTDTDSYAEVSAGASKDENLTFKVFVWDNEEPLTDVINIDSNGIN
ncbi:MAG: hypothetical protein IJC74_03770 [Clostridia bacterium]|nr:hypothetical protein [Clostridia bacterium]